MRKWIRQLVAKWFGLFEVAPAPAGPSVMEQLLLANFAANERREAALLTTLEKLAGTASQQGLAFADYMKMVAAPGEPVVRIMSDALEAEQELARIGQRRIPKPKPSNDDFFKEHFGFGGLAERQQPMGLSDVLANVKADVGQLIS